MAKFLCTIVSGMIFGLIVMGQAHAIELHAVKDSNTGVVTLTEESVNAAWSSDRIVCLKDGASFIGGNKAYAAAFGNKSKRCAPSQAGVVKSLTGKELIVFKLNQLPASVIKTLNGRI